MGDSEYKAPDEVGLRIVLASTPCGLRVRRSQRATYSTPVYMLRAARFALHAATELTNNVSQGAPPAPTPSCTDGRGPQGPSTIVGDVGCFPGVVTADQLQGATLQGVVENRGGAVSRMVPHYFIAMNKPSFAALALQEVDLVTVFADLSSRTATTADSLSSRTIYPGVHCAQSFTLESGGALTFDGLGNNDSHFIMNAASFLNAAPDSVMLLRNGAEVRPSHGPGMLPQQHESSVTMPAGQSHLLGS